MSESQRRKPRIPAARLEPTISVADGEPRPRWRGRLHIFALLGTLPAGIILLLRAETVQARVGLAVYVASLAISFGTSAAYHTIARSPVAQRWMRRLDHAAIFVNIAGTYTPVCLLALPADWGRPVLIAVWSAAVAGIGLKLLARDWLLRASNVLYIVMGWIATLMLPVILAHLTGVEFGLLITGGVFYTIGALLFSIHRPRLRPLVFGYHEVWHLFTVVGAAAHFGMVWLVASGSPV